MSATKSATANGGNPNGGEDMSSIPPAPPPDDEEQQQQQQQPASPSSPEELARRSGFVPATATAPPTAPGAYHVLPLPLGGLGGGSSTAQQSDGSPPGALGLGRPADSVDGAAAVRRRSTTAGSSGSRNYNYNSEDDDGALGGADTAPSELSYEYHVAVAHLVEDAACEPAPAAAAANATASGSGSGRAAPAPGEGGGDATHRSSVSALSASVGIAAAATATASASAAGTGSDGIHGDGVGNGHAGSGENHANNPLLRASRRSTGDPEVVVAEKLDRRSITMCGRHGRWQRWHCAVVGALLLGACVVVPTAVVVGGNARRSSSNSSTSSNQQGSSSSSSQQGNNTGEDSGSPLHVLDWTRPGLLESIVVPSVSDPSTLRDASSPQSRALRWLQMGDERGGGGGGGAAAVTGPDVPTVEWRIRQRYALAVLYHATGGDRWKQRYGFLDVAADHECEWGSTMLNNGWTALECNDGGEVTLINLWQNRLAGTLPGRELAAALPALTALDFLTNQLTGTLPVALTALPSLNYLNLGYNRLVGTVPSELGNLDQITYLMVDWNDLTGTIPPELGRLVQLSGWLSLEGNQLTGTVPPSFANLTQATWIYLNNNDLTGSAEFLCDALHPVEGPGYTHDDSASPLLELWVDVEEVNCTCCNCCPFYDR